MSDTLVPRPAAVSTWRGLRGPGEDVDTDVPPRLRGDPPRQGEVVRAHGARVQGHLRRPAERVFRGPWNLEQPRARVRADLQKTKIDIPEPLTVCRIDGFANDFTDLQAICTRAGESTKASIRGPGACSASWDRRGSIPLPGTQDSAPAGPPRTTWKPACGIAASGHAPRRRARAAAPSPVTQMH
jgi:hypothetical protein